MTSSQLKEILPEEFDIVTQFATALPAGGFTPAYPFTGFVVNLNVVTKLHRDWGDLKFCLVMAISDGCTGGDLCFLEPGIRLELGHGDLVLFRSAELSHFNMHFRGKRASIVFHSDAAGVEWVKSRNEWKGSVYMNDSILID